MSEALDEAVGKALAKDPADRWPTAAAFAKALLAAVEHADVEEVAEYVRASVGQKIEQRREQIRAMGMVRAKIGEIAEASEMTPSGDHVRAPPTSVEIAPIEESDTTEVASGPVVSASVVAQLDAPAVPATPAEESAPPAKAADSTVNIRGVRTPPRWALPVVAGVVGFGCVVLAIAALARHGHDAPAQSAQSASATAPVQPARTEVATTVATSATVAPVAVPATTTAASATTTPLRSSAPAATATAAPNPTSVVNRPVAPRATARTAPSATSKLAPSPY